MSTLPNGGGRFLDGPSRRPLPSGRPVAPRQPVQHEKPRPTAVVEPAAPVAREETIFEYKKPKRFKRWLGWKLVRRLALVMVAVVVVGTSWFGYQAWSAAHKIIVHDNAGAPALTSATLKPTQLNGEGSGRVNILVMGIGGAGHDGPNLSDTMMVWSIDPQTKDVAMLSVPRDLYVKIPGHGYGKINSANALGGPKLAEQVVETVIGVPIHYYAVVDFSGFKQAVDAVGGVDIDVTTPLIDPKYPCDDGTKYANDYCPIHFNVGVQHMNGATALKYSRSRETTSDFARAARQQQVLVAVRQKALAASTLTNPAKVTGLIEAIGNHFKTDLQFKDMMRLASIVKDMDTSKITQKVLDTGQPDSLLIDGSGTIAGAGSIELPKAGTFNYSDVQDFVKNIFVDHYITNENAKLEVENGSDVTGLAAQVVNSLQLAHYNVGAAVNATAPVAQTVIYDYTHGTKPYTINYLQQRFNVKAQVVSAPSPEVDASGNALPVPDIRIILGSNYQPNTNTATSTTTTSR